MNTLLVSRDYKNWSVDATLIASSLADMLSSASSLAKCGDAGFEWGRWHTNNLQAVSECLLSASAEFERVDLSER